MKTRFTLAFIIALTAFAPLMTPSQPAQAQAAALTVAVETLPASLAPWAETGADFAPFAANVYETLLTWDPALGDFAPSLATHWQVLPDKRTFRFRLDPEARWSDGRPGTADDVAATLEHLGNPDRRDPYSQDWRDKIESVKVLDDLTVEVRSREPRSLAVHRRLLDPPS